MRDLVRRITSRTVRLSWVAPHTDPAIDAPADAVRPLGQVSLSGQTHDAWFCHPPAALIDRLPARAGGVLRVPVALLPEARDAHPAGIQITVTLSRVHSGRAATATAHLRPGQAGHWIELPCRLPVFDAGDDDHITMRVQSTLADGANSAWAWAIVGAPLHDIPRPARELAAIGRTLLVRGRHEGWASVWRSARTRLQMAPAVSYAAWALKNDPDASALAHQRAASRTWPSRPLVSVITPAYNTRPEWLRACHDSLRRQTYDRWEWCVCDDASPDPDVATTLAELSASPDARMHVVRRATNGGISLASNDALALATGDIVVLLDHDDALTPWALWDVVSAFNADPDLRLLYSDEDKLDPQGARCDPYFKPDWSPELLLATNYACHLTAARRDLIAEVGGFRPGFEGAQDYDLWLRMTEVARHVHHIPKVLYHWRMVPGSTAAAQTEKPWATDAGRRALASAVERRGWQATVEPGATDGRYRVRMRASKTPVSILLPTYGSARCPQGHAAVAARAVASMRETTPDHPLEFIVATDDGSVPAAVARALAGVPHTMTAVPGAFNFSARINAAARTAHHAVLLIANDDLDARDAGWLEALLDYAERPEIGAAGPRLDLPDGRIQHAGLTLGVCGIAAHAWHHAPAGQQGYFGNVISPRNVSAVTGACLMTRAAVFADVGGFDEAFPRDFNDVDYCLKVQQRGLRVVYTPYARLRHHESESIGLRAPADREQALMRARWGQVIERDPFYHPNLSRDHIDFRLR